MYISLEKRRNPMLGRFNSGVLPNPDMFEMDDEGLGELAGVFKKTVNKALSSVNKVASNPISSTLSVVGVETPGFVKKVETIINAPLSAPVKVLQATWNPVDVVRDPKGTVKDTAKGVLSPVTVANESVAKTLRWSEEIPVIGSVTKPLNKVHTGVNDYLEKIPGLEAGLLHVETQEKQDKDKADAEQEWRNAEAAQQAEEINLSNQQSSPIPSGPVYVPPPIISTSPDSYYSRDPYDIASGMFSDLFSNVGGGGAYAPYDNVAQQEAPEESNDMMMYGMLAIGGYVLYTLLQRR